MSKPHSQSRTIYTVLVLAVLAFSWIYMQWTHELGHILAGLATGAAIDRVILDPRTFSMTLFHSTPHPLNAAWGGPILGVITGAGIPLLLTRALPRFRFSLRIVAAFVLLANGLYIGLGAAYPVGDAQSLIMFGAHRWMLAIFGIACIVPARLILAPVLRKQIKPSSNAEPVPYIIMSITLATIGLIMFR